ncbi:YdcF family protein [Paenibacillus aquistagni]|uniref:Uncharacterized SAM-binding protein YcdF, DUF218 family n=1 Tax=Paenibacillus aquistagni TaxID=1852522 RepID=A0A1X7IXS2_9BACL|nr:YdcF family protein [Paenibacillus aquistagni]SMG19982.1 Uncharacterized SAM-binding protein YcdF, DUF218 family [Paenibacillus aquistagni]
MIPKYPKVPELSDKQIDEITKVVFCNDIILNKADLLFVFGSTDPGAVTQSLNAFKQGVVNEILISGGSSTTGIKHEDWTDGTKTEAQSIRDKLIQHGVPEDIIFIEDKSSNSKENVLFAKELFDFTQINSLYFVSKSHAVGRQYRTLQKYISSQIKMAPYPYETKLKESDNNLNHLNWMEYPESRSLVIGEYLRIIYYGMKGDIVSVDGVVEGLEEYVRGFF